MKKQHIVRKPNTQREIRAALLNRENYRNGQAKDWKPVEWHGYYSLRRGIASQLNTMTRNHIGTQGKSGFP